MKELVEKLKRLANKYTPLNADGWEEQSVGVHLPTDEEGLIKRGYRNALELVEATLSPRPIEEAPRDGESTFLLLIRDKGVPIWVIGFWDGVEWCHDRVELGALYEQPTHWLPLPSMDGGEK